MIDFLWHVGQAIALSWMLVLSLTILWALYALLCAREEEKRVYYRSDLTTTQRLCDDACKRAALDVTLEQHQTSYD